MRKNKYLFVVYLYNSYSQNSLWVAFPVYNGIAYWTAMPVKVDENYYFSAQYGGATTFNQAISFGYNIRPVADR